MIRKLLLASVALCSASAAAAAADLPARMAAPAPAVYAPPVFTWTGFYVGVNAGAAWTGKDSCPMGGDYNDSNYSAWNGYGAHCDGGDSNTSFIGGGQAGINWQTGALVLGLEGDIDWTGHGHSGRYDYDTGIVPDVVGSPAEGTYSYRGGHGGDMLSTIRGRLGFAADRALFYVTGGVAFRDSGSDGSMTYNDGDSYTFTRNHSDNNVGWVIGGGIEYALTDNVSAKVEYIHAQFDKDNGLYTDPNCPEKIAFSDKRDNSVDAIRVGLNFRFGAPAPTAVSPVTARY